MAISQDDPERIIGNDKFVDSFFYLGDSIGQSGSCFEARTDSAAWKNFQSLLPVLKNSGISLKVRGHAYL